MREIKFKQYYQDSDGNYSKYVQLVENYTINDFFYNSQKVENIITVQYIGLKAKNGVEVYEGDIIRDTTLYSNGKIVEVIYDHDILGYWFYSEENGVTTISKKLSKHYEVIGNIYENKDLKCQ